MTALTLIAVVLTVLSSDVAAEPAARFERWFVVEVDGSKAGWARESELEDDRGNLTSSTEMNFSLQRMGQAIDIRMVSEFMETPAGDPLRMRSEQVMGGGRVVQTYTFVAGIESYTVRQVTESAGRTAEQTLAWPEGEWMTPGAARRDVEARLAAGQTEIALRTLDPSIGLEPLTITQRVVGKQNVEVLGKTVPAIRWEVTNSALPGVVGRDFVDLRGRTLRSEMDFGGFRVTLLASEKEIAMSPFSPPEMMAQTLIEPTGKRIASPRSASRAMYLLTLPAGAEFPEIPSLGVQSVERAGDALRVTVDLSASADADAAPAACSRRSSMIDSSDPAIAELVRGALAELPQGADDAARAEALRRAVHRHVKTASLGVGFATASEVVRSRTGDCSEFGVLFAAALRAAGIPSRVVSGLVLVENFEGKSGVFGYHVWTQARLGSAEQARWIDLDATLAGDRPFDATHIALSHTCMSDGEVVNSMAGLVALLGRLEIEVLEAR